MTSRIPEDSVLKRHYVASVMSEILAELPPRPTDSVLARHYDADVASRLAARTGDSGTTEAGAVPAAQARSAPKSAAAGPRPAASTAPEGKAAGGGGLFGWLKRLLGG
jgi:hypothetical protein